MAHELTFTNEEAAYLERIAKYHEVTKRLLIFGEHVDPENKTLAQSINELRNCLEHLMRVFSFKFGLREGSEDDDYVITNLDKAFGHVYRAAYDTLDWISLTLKGRMIDELQGFSLETLQAVLPEYFTDIKPRFEEILADEVTSLRMEKDVARKSEDNLVKYGQVTAELTQLFKRIISSKSALVEYETRLAKSRRKERLVRIVEGIAIGLVVGIAVGIVVGVVVG